MLNDLLRLLLAKAKSGLQAICMAEIRAQVNKTSDALPTMYAAKYPQATDCRAKDQETLMTFYNFPAEHWMHLKSSNVIESTFAAIRHRTKRVKGAF